MRTERRQNDDREEAKQLLERRQKDDRENKA